MAISSLRFSTETCKIASPIGSYCSGPSNITVCPPGTFCPQANMAAPMPCPAGNYCPYSGMTSYQACWSNSYCPAQSASQLPCPPGGYCPYGSSAPQPCPAFNYCPGGYMGTYGCPSQTYCPGGNITSPLPCPESTAWCDGGPTWTRCTDLSGAAFPLTLKGSTLAYNGTNSGVSQRQCWYFQVPLSKTSRICC